MTNENQAIMPHAILRVPDVSTANTLGERIYLYLLKFIQDGTHDDVLAYDQVHQAFQNLFSLDRDVISYNEVMNLFELREYYTKRFGYAVLNEKFINDLVAYLKPMRTVELGAGSGYLSHQLRRNGVDITAVDNDSWHIDWALRSQPIIKADQHLFDLSGYQAVIMSWPNYESDTAWRVLNNLNHDQVLIYIGEGWGGCTADDKFHQILDDEFIQLTLESELLNKHMLSFSGIHDTVYVYRRLPDAVALIAGE